MWQYGAQDAFRCYVIEVQSWLGSVSGVQFSLFSRTSYSVEVILVGDVVK